MLLVEDNFIIALDTADMLRELGVAHVWTAASTSEALKVVAEQEIQFALLDVNLGEEKGFEIAARLRERDIPFAFATGYREQSPAFPPEFAGVPVVSKPYQMDNVAAVIAPHGAPRDRTSG